MANGTIRNPRQIIRRFVTDVAKAYPIDQVVLYGSYARGWQKTWSDIDLAIVSKEFDRCTPATWKTLRRFASTVSPLLDARLLGRKEFAQFARGDFVHEIHRTGKTIYQRGRFRFPETLDILEDEPDIVAKLRKAERDIRGGRGVTWKSVHRRDRKG